MPSTKTIDTREGHLGISISTSDVCYGVVIDRLDAKDLCALAGLRAGLVITHLNGSAVSDHSEAMEVMNEAKEAGNKLTFAFLTEDEASEQGARESATNKKWCLRVGIVALLLVAGLGAFAYTKYIEFQSDVVTKRAAEPNQGAPDMASMMDQMKGMLPPDFQEKMAEMREKMNPGGAWATESAEDAPSVTIDDAPAKVTATP